MTTTVRAVCVLVGISLTGSTVAAVSTTGPVVGSPSQCIGSQVTLTTAAGAVDAGHVRIVESATAETTGAIADTVPVVAGYTRLDDSGPLDHETRQRLFDAIGDNPGIYVTERARRTDEHVSTVRYHVRVLEGEELVARTNRRGRSQLRLVGSDHPVSPAAQRGPRRAILSALDRNGPATGRELTDQLDKAKSTVSYHLRRLAEDGLISRERDGRTVVNALSADPVGTDAASGDD